MTHTPFGKKNKKYKVQRYMKILLSMHNLTETKDKPFMFV